MTEQIAMFSAGEHLGGHKTRQVATLAVPLTIHGDYRLCNTEGELATLYAALRHATIAGEPVAWDTEVHGCGPEVNPHLPGVQMTGMSFAIGETAWYIPLRHEHTDVPQLNPDRVRRALIKMLHRAYLCGHNAKFDTHIMAYEGYGDLPIAFDTYTAAHYLQYLIEPNQKGYFKKNLKALSKAELGIETITFQEVIARSGQSMADPDFRYVRIDDAVAYACHDAMQTLRLMRKFRTLLEPTAMWPLFSRVDMPFMTLLSRMERQGVLIDPEYFAAQFDILYQEIAGYDEEIRAILGYQVTKPAEVGALLYTTFGLPVRKKTKGGKSKKAEPSVDAEALRDLIRHIKANQVCTAKYTTAQLTQVIALIMKRSKVQKIVSTYDLRRDASGEEWVKGTRYLRVCTRFNLEGAASGRLSSDSPNLQNLPREVGPGSIRYGVMGLSAAGRACFLREYGEAFYRVLGLSIPKLPETLHLLLASRPYPTPHEHGSTWGCFDLGQIEPRGAAMISEVYGDPSFANLLRDPERGDPYKGLAAGLTQLRYEEITKALREVGKTGLLAIIYGSSAEGLAGHPKMIALGKHGQPPSVDEIQEAIDRLYITYWGLKVAQRNSVFWAVHNGYTEHLWGYRRPALDLRCPSTDKGFATKRKGESRSVRNQVIQGWAAAYLKAAMVWAMMLIDALGLEQHIQIALTVHDEQDPIIDTRFLRIAVALFGHTMTQVWPGHIPITFDAELGSRWGDILDVNKWKEVPEQYEHTDAIIAWITEQASPFADFPLAPDISRNFDTAVVAMEDLPLYAWHAADLGVALGDLRIPNLADHNPQGIIVHARTYDPRTSGGRTMWKATLVGRDRTVELVSWTIPLRDGRFHVYGQNETYQGKPNIVVTHLISVESEHPYTEALRTGTPREGKQGHIRFDELRRAIDEAQHAAG